MTAVVVAALLLLVAFRMTQPPGTFLTATERIGRAGVVITTAVLCIGAALTSFGFAQAVHQKLLRSFLTAQITSLVAACLLILALVVR
ncbi:hypothetical protein [Actinomarinicola tropica]|uniref:Uncharacterized protein n=1 Tax=Actinomarinicola tropica TaxID=2789776 RepID=A0A5Q2RGR2_9ACTN|nr:hypothetical protein [Actinomarinicola tropica]QGG96019.1 hypothetical protein GH723_13440 [Actinomarinicola tropica]